MSLTTIVSEEYSKAFLKELRGKQKKEFKKNPKKAIRQNKDLAVLYNQFLIKELALLIPRAYYSGKEKCLAQVRRRLKKMAIEKCNRWIAMLSNRRILTEKYDLYRSKEELFIDLFSSTKIKIDYTYTDIISFYKNRRNLLTFNARTNKFDWFKSEDYLGRKLQFGFNNFHAMDFLFDDMDADEYNNFIGFIEEMLEKYFPC